MFRSRWLHNWTGLASSRMDRRRLAARSRKPVRLLLESLEERLTPSGGNPTVTQTAGGYTALTAAVAADTATNTNYVIQITNSFTFNSGGQVSISKLGAGSTLTIEGQNGANFTLTGNGNRLFSIGKGQTVTFTDLTLTGGTIAASSLDADRGGAILDQGGNVTLSKAVVEDNKVSGPGPAGGGVYLSAGSTVQIIDSTLSNNGVQAGVSALSGITNGSGFEASGGGLYVSSSTVTLTGDTLSGNRAVGGNGGNGGNSGENGGNGGNASGGGLYVGSGSTVTLTADTLSDNSAVGGNGGNGGNGGKGGIGGEGGNASGGGIYVSGFSWNMTLTGNTLSNNSVSCGNGGNSGDGKAANRGGAASGGGADFLDSDETGSVGNIIDNITDSLTILNNLAAPTSDPSTFIDNSVLAGASNQTGGNVGQGGGVFISDLFSSPFAVNLGNTTFYGNKISGGNGGFGGGLYVRNGQVAMANCTIANNTITGNNGGTGSGIEIVDTGAGSRAFLFFNTIVQNTVSGGASAGGGGLAFDFPNFLNLFDNIIQGNQSANSSAPDLLVLDAGNLPLSVTGQNFIGSMSANAVSTAFGNTIGNSQVQLGSVVGVDSQGNPTGGPIYYPLLPGAVSVGVGFGSPDIVAEVEGTTIANATDEIGNHFSATGSFDRGAVQAVLTPSPPSPSPSPPSPTPSPSLSPPVLQVPPLLAFFDAILGGVETVNANGTETITDRFFGFPLLVSRFDSHGQLVSVDLFGINVTFLFELLG